MATWFGRGTLITALVGGYIIWPQAVIGTAWRKPADSNMQLFSD